MKDVLQVLSRNKISPDRVECVNLNASLFRNFSSFRLRVKDIAAHRLLSPTFWPNCIGVRVYVWIPKPTGIQLNKNATDVVVDNL